MARKNVQEIKAIPISQNNGPYVPTMVDINDLHIHDRGFAWRLASCTKDDIVQKRYFLTNGEGKQELSDKPGRLGGHQRYKIYGRMDCSSANRHISKGRYIRGRVFFADEETAIAAGYRPCAICMRSEYNKWKNNHNG